MTMEEAAQSQPYDEPAKVEAPADWVGNLLRLTKAASKGPWRICTASDSRCSCGFIWSGDGNFDVAHANKETEFSSISEETYQANKVLLAAAPALLAEVRRLTTALKMSEDLRDPDAWEKAVKQWVQWSEKVERLTAERDEARALMVAGMSPGSTSAEVAAVERWNAEAKKAPTP